MGEDAKERRDEAAGRAGRPPAEPTQADLEEAFKIAAEVFDLGGWMDSDRSDPVVLSGRPKRLAEAAARLLPALKRVVEGPRRDWARGRVEAAIAVDFAETSDPVFAVISLRERRRVGEGFVGRLSSPEARRRLEALLEGCVGVAMSAPTRHERAAVGRLLAELGVGRGKLEMIETEGRDRADYRNYLAGSFWLDFDPASAKTAGGRALLAALQTRSIRKTGLKVVRQGWYTALAARALAATGLDAKAVASTLRCPAALAAKWIQDDGGRDARRPPTENQARFVEDILKDVPELAIRLPEDWRQDGRAASAFISAARPHRKEWRRQRSELAQSRRLREALAADAVWSKILKEESIDSAQAALLLEVPLADQEAAFAESVTTAFAEAAQP